MKIFPPLGNRVHYITQTYHGESATNPNNLAQQCAIDISATGGHPVYAAADGTIVNATPNAGSYCTLDIGEGFWILYVHTVNLLPIGTKVKRGQKIAEIKPMKGSHLHFGFKNKSRVPPHPQPMDYVDRGVTWSTRYQEIKDIWFKNGSINWGLFRDLHVGPTPDDCAKKIKEAVDSANKTANARIQEAVEARKRAEQQLVDANTQLKELEGLKGRLEGDLARCMERNEKLEKDARDYANTFRELNERIASLEEKNRRLVEDNSKLAEKLKDCQGGGSPAGCGVPLAFIANKLSRLLNGDTLYLGLEEKGAKGGETGKANKLPG